MVPPPAAEASALIAQADQSHCAERNGSRSTSTRMGRVIRGGSRVAFVVTNSLRQATRKPANRRTVCTIAPGLTIAT
jgi:hypothetical protein